LIPDDFEVVKTSKKPAAKKITVKNVYATKGNSGNFRPFR
jgi:hypothetical protein